MTLRAQSKQPLYGSFPSEPLDCFCSLVLTKSKGKLKKDAKKPAMAEAPKVCVDGDRDGACFLSCFFDSAKKESCPKFRAIARITVGEAPAQSARIPSVPAILFKASNTER